MRKVLIAVGVIVVLLIAAVVAIPFFVPVETIKNQVVAGVKDSTGRDLAIRGPVKLSVFPTLSVDVRDVAFANAAGSRNKDMATLGTLQVDLKLVPLLSGRVEIDKFVLVDPIIHIEVDKAGKGNWVFGQQAAGPASGSGTKPAEVALGDVRIANGLLTYDDARTGASYKLEKLNVKLDLPSLDGPMKAKGDVVYNARKLDLEVDVGKLRDLMDGRATAVSLALGGEPLKLAFKGNAASGAAMKVDGDVDLSVPSIKALAAWAGSPIEAREKTMGPLAIKGKVAVDGNRYSFSNATIDIDEIKSKGQMSVDMSGAKPTLKGKLDIAALDLNPYLPPETAEKPAANQPGATDWSTDPIDLSGLKAADAEFDLSVGSLKVRKIEIGKSVLATALKGGRLQLDLKEMALYEGSGTGRVVADGSGAVPGIESQFKMQGVQLAPLLKAAADNDKLSGKGSFDVTTSGRGKSQKEIISSLGGGGSIDFRDGAIKGFDLAEIVQMARDLKGAVTGAATGQTKQTDFSELTGTFKIAGGIVSNDDLQMKSPLLRVTGKGTVEMPPKTVNYRVEPKLAATTKGQGGREDATGITIPVMIKGPWHNISYQPDMGAILKDAATGKVMEGVKGAIPIPGIGGSSGGTGGTTTAPSTPTNPLKGLFGR